MILGYWGMTTMSYTFRFPPRFATRALLQCCYIAKKREKYFHQKLLFSLADCLMNDQQHSRWSRKVNKFPTVKCEASLYDDANLLKSPFMTRVINHTSNVCKYSQVNRYWIQKCRQITTFFLSSVFDKCFSVDQVRI